MINSFVCKPSPMTKKEVCGADASATFSRAEFGVNFGDKFGFKQVVKLQIQVEGSPSKSGASPVIRRPGCSRPFSLVRTAGCSLFSFLTIKDYTAIQRPSTRG
jgi:hypothetical protein